MIIYGSDDPGAIVYIKNFLIGSKYKKQEIKTIRALNNINKKVNFIITGSALGDTLDKKIIKWGKQEKIITISVIEHWTFFKKRFLINNKLFYPDFIFVNDTYAKKLAIKEGIPKKKIFISGNNYFRKIIKKKNINKFKTNTNKKVLFISEPLSESHSGKTLSQFGYNEFKILDSILKNKPTDWNVTIKLHPKEKMQKYKKYLNNIRFLKVKNHRNIIQNYNFIIGMTSILLLELGVYRSDIISYRLNSKDSFIGEKFGLTKNITKEKQLINCFKKKPKNINIKFIQKINSIKIKADMLFELISLE